MNTTTFETRQFKSGNSQAIRIPTKLAYPPRTELKISRIGDKIVIEPKDQTLADFVQFLRSVGKQHDGKRVDMDIPERQPSC